ncbi:MAG: toxin TcdB middle/N-terminal domain-containing protein [Verrucomicrobiota bacterium]
MSDITRFDSTCEPSTAVTAALLSKLSHFFHMNFSKGGFGCMQNGGISSWMQTGICMMMLLALCPVACFAGVGDAGPAPSESQSAGLQHKVDSQFGSFSYQVPVVVPPGRQGAQPELGLRYNSGGGNGWCGVGWGLEVGYIQRNIKKGVPVKWSTGAAPLKEYDDAKGFISTAGGGNASLVLVDSSNPNYLEYRQEIETAFLKYRYYTDNHWEILDKNGNTFYFGQVAASRMENTQSGWTANAGKSTFRWALDRVVDVNGNETVLTYTKISGLLYLSNISYNGNINGSLPRTHTVDFVLTDRPDASIAFNTGYRVETKKLLSEIHIKVSGQNVRKYVLVYTNSFSTKRSLLKSVTEYGTDFATALPAVTFNYQVQAMEFEPPVTWPCKDWAGVRSGAINGATYTYAAMLDIDGDGLPDRVGRKMGSTPYDEFTVYRNLGNGNGFASSPSSWGTIDNQGLSYLDWSGTLEGTSDGMTGTDTLDLNGDGRPDHVSRDEASLVNWRVQLNSGLPGSSAYSSSSFWPVTSESGNHYWHGLRWFQASSLSQLNDTMDMNGDGLPDRVMRQLNSPYNRFKVQLNTGSGFSSSVDWSLVRGQDSLAALLYTTVDMPKHNVNGFLALLKSRTTPLALWLYGQLPTATQTIVNNSPYTYSYGVHQPDPFLPIQQAMINGFNQIIQSGLVYDSARFAGVTLSSATSEFLNELPAATGVEQVRLNRMLLSDAYPNPPTYPPRSATPNDSTYLPFAVSADWRTLSQRESSVTKALMADINGDGLPDRVMRKAEPPYDKFLVQFNNGAGFEEPENWGTLDSQGMTDAAWNSPIGNNDSQTWAALIDVTGDGLVDRVMRKATAPYNSEWLVQVNTGSGFSPATNHWTGLDPTKTSADENSIVAAASWFSAYMYVNFFDINGDGLPDRLTTAGWPAQGQTTWNLDVQLNKGPYPDLLNVVSNDLGGTVTVNYAPSTRWDNRDKDWTTDPWTEGAKSLLSFPVQTVTNVVVNDGFGNTDATSYAYKGGYFNPARREFRGFHCVETKNSFGLKELTYFHQGGGYNGSAKGEYQDQEGKQGVPYLVENYDKDNVLVSRVLNKYGITSPIAGVLFPYLEQTIKMDYADGISYRATAEQVGYDSLNGNVIASTNLGEVVNVTLSTHSFTDLVPADNVLTLTTYKNIPGSPLMVSKPDIAIISKWDLSDSRKKRFNYDARGNPTTTEVWLSSENRWLTKHMVQYDALGNPWRSTDANGVVTEITYDATYKQFPEIKILAPGTSLQMVATSLFDARSGQAIRATDNLGVIAKTDYDVFFRPTATYVNETPNAEPTLWRTRTDYYLQGINGANSNNKIYVRTYDPNDPVNGIESFTYLDGLGRKIQTRVESEINGTYRCSDSYYETESKTSFEPLPYFATGSTYSARTSVQLGTLKELNASGLSSRVTPAVQATFDASRRRVGAVTFTGGDAADAPVSAATMTYGEGADPWVTISTDSEGKVTKTYSDAFSHVIEIVNITAQGNISTRYAYDITGLLTRLTDNASNQTTILYDSLGRKTSMTDPDMGHWVYVYDDAGRMTDQTDAKNQRIHFNYDPVLGRLANKEIYDSGGILKRRITYQYDTPAKSGCTVQNGQLAAITETSTSGDCITDQKFWSYDYKGRVLKEGVYSWAFGEFVTTSSYNQADQLDVLTYPNDVARMKHTYQNGVLKRIQSLKGTGTTSEIFYELTSINEMGQPLTYMTHNGQVQNTHEFYGNSKRLKKLSVTKGTTDILGRTYKFDSVSNVKAITDNVATHTGLSSGSIQNLQYDDLHRLTGMTDASGTRTYQYHVLGNLIVNGDGATGPYTYGSSKPHAVTAANGRTYGYDANGNMINRNGQNLVYDEENRLIQVSGGNVNVHFGYAYDGSRLWKFNKNTDQYTCFVSPLFEYREKDSAGLCYVFANGQRIAAFRPTTHVYTLASTELPWNDRATTFFAGISDRANTALAWLLNPRRIEITGIALAGIITLAILLMGRFKLGIRLERREERIYFRPLWCRLVTLLLIPVLLLAIMPAQAAFVPGEVFYYYHADHLGSSNVTTDRNGNIIQHYEHKAYGGERYGQNNAAGNPEYNLTHRFTGQVLDEDTGLYYYNSRYYDPELGRFTQPDTIVPSVSVSQTLNRYTYCNNNPLKYVDPTGHIADWVIAVIIGAVLGGISAAASGGNIGMGILTGAIGGLLGGIGGALYGALGAMAGGALAGAVNAAITGGNIGFGALTGAIGGAIGFGASEIPIPRMYIEELVEWGLAAGSGALSGGIGAELQGGKFADGAKLGAINGAAGHSLSQFMEQFKNGETMPPEDQQASGQMQSVYNREGNMPPGVPYKPPQGFAAYFTPAANGLPAFLAFRGTQPLSLIDWITNFKQSLGVRTAQYAYARELGLQIEAATGGRVVFTGHSLGGGLAMAAGVACGGRVPVVTFNAAGLFSFGAVPANARNYYIPGEILTSFQRLTPFPDAWGRQIPHTGGGWGTFGHSSANFPPGN